MTRVAVQSAVVVALLCCVCRVGSAQKERPFEIAQEPALPYFGMGAGFTPTLMFVDVTDFNALADDLGLDEVAAPMLTYGAMLVFSPSFLRNVRVGGHFCIGYHATSGSVEIDGQRYTRMLRFGIRFMGGLQAEYAVGLARRLTLMPGLSVGYGSCAFEFNQSRADAETFSNVFGAGRFDGGSSDGDAAYGLQLASNAVFLRPMIALEFAPSGMIMFRLAGGYTLGLQSGWYDQGGTEYTGMPELSTTGPFVQLGTFLGLFQQ